jgi:hypothetical protein
VGRTNVSGMGELRLYAVGLDEVRGIFGASAEAAPRLRAMAQQAFTTAPDRARTGLLSKLGPIFRRPPAVQVISPTQPEPQDVEVLLAGGYVRPERTGATWRVLETLVCGLAWGSTRLSLSSETLDDLDFALARGGVSAAVGLRHLLDTGTGLTLVPVQGLTVGYHRYETALAMAGAYRAALPQIQSSEKQQVVNALASWLDGFVPWSQAAAAQHRPVPDLLGFWAQ